VPSLGLSDPVRRSRHRRRRRETEASPLLHGCLAWAPTRVRSACGYLYGGLSGYVIRFLISAASRVSGVAPRAGVWDAGGERPWAVNSCTCAPGRRRAVGNLSALIRLHVGDYTIKV
jgi:hypothetical protein